MVTDWEKIHQKHLEDAVDALHWAAFYCPDRKHAEELKLIERRVRDFLICEVTRSGVQCKQCSNCTAYCPFGSPDN